jgi:hypothetical protein
MFNVQRHIYGLYCEMELHYEIDVNERGAFVDLKEVWILGHYPEGCTSSAVDRGDYVSINAKADIGYLTSAEIEDLEAACLAHAKVCATDVDYE